MHCPRQTTTILSSTILSPLLKPKIPREDPSLTMSDRLPLISAMRRRLAELIENPDRGPSCQTRVVLLVFRDVLQSWRRAAKAREVLERPAEGQERAALRRYARYSRRYHAELLWQLAAGEMGWGW